MELVVVAAGNLIAAGRNGSAEGRSSLTVSLCLTSTHERNQKIFLPLADPFLPSRTHGCRSLSLALSVDGHKAEAGAEVFCCGLGELVQRENGNGMRLKWV